jgi:hypothetical protein
MVQMVHGTRYMVRTWYMVQIVHGTNGKWYKLYRKNGKWYKLYRKNGTWYMWYMVLMVHDVWVPWIVCNSSRSMSSETTGSAPMASHWSPGPAGFFLNTLVSSFQREMSRLGCYLHGHHCNFERVRHSCSRRGH